MEASARMGMVTMDRALLALYQAGELRKAKDRLLEVVEIDPNDSAAHVFLARIDHYEREGLPKNWKGVQEFAH